MIVVKISGEYNNKNLDHTIEIDEAILKLYPSPSIGLGKEVEAHTELLFDNIMEGGR